ncbi:MAG: hypothetical protein LBL34_05010 [Clostridiales bacterium]|jgi:hypothetical protein|nr:hypothetical protein [Clostridiales bacterium]
MKVEIDFKQVDPAAKNDAAFAVSEQEPWSDIALFNEDGINPGPNCMTLEENYSVLDGVMDEFPDDAESLDWGWWSATLSDIDGAFTPIPTIDITFGSNHKSLGVTLYFYPYSTDYASLVRVTWYDAADNILATGEYANTKVVCAVEESVIDYRRIKIELLMTNVPYRFAKIYAIDFGVAKVFEDRDIDTANILEEIDPISDIISVNTLGFKVKTHDPEFSIVTGNAADQMLMKQQMMTVKGDDAPFGVFFLDTWKDSQNNGTVFDFQLVDAIGVMDNYRFYGGMYNNKDVSELLGKLFSLCFPTGLIGFVLDAELQGQTLTGYLPIMTAREALQQICFAMGAVADTSRRNYVWIYPRDTTPQFSIPKEKIYQGGQIQPTTYFSGLDLVAFDYSVDSETSEAYKGNLATGEFTLEFSEPYTGLSITGADILEYGVNYARVSVSTPGEVVITGNKYEANEVRYTARDELNAGEIENVCVFDKCTLVNQTNAQGLLDKLFSYLKQRAQIESDVRLDDLEPGYVAQIETYGKPITGTIEKLDIDIRGSRAKARIVGNVD